MSWSTEPAATPDICTTCHRPISANAQWADDMPYCPPCAFTLVTAGQAVHGSRIQDRFWTAAGQVRPGLNADRWLMEEFPVVISGRRFRADFVLRFFPHPKVAVELDSFTHHSSSLALVRDHQRQRLFQKDGWRVIRFAGSEVWHDPVACVEELIEIIRCEVAGSQMPLAT